MGQSNLQLLDSADVMELFRFSKSTLWRLIGEGKFPKPVYVGQSPRWQERALSDYLAERGVDVKAPKKKRDLDELC